MASEQKNAGTGSDGGESLNPTWTNTNNITSSNNIYSVVSLNDVDAISNTLSATNFGFSIPSLAEIDGIICTIERKASSNNTIKDYSVRILKNGTIPSGSDDKKDTLTFWSTTEGDVSYGSPSDLWNTTWTSSDINNSNFGFQIRCEYIPDYSSASASVDLMYITIHYSIGKIKFFTESISKIYYGSEEIKSVYYGQSKII